MTRRNREQIRRDIIRACPDSITRVLSRASVTYVRGRNILMKMVVGGFIEIREEDPRLYGINRKTPAKIYHVTPKGRKLLEAKG